MKVATGDRTYPFLEELRKGAEAAKRIVARVSDAHQRSENVYLTQCLLRRVGDWKGHRPETFGALLLEQMLRITKGDVERLYQVCLFEKVLLCCKEVTAGEEEPIGTQALGGKTITRRCPLLLKGRIFVSNVIRAVMQTPEEGGKWQSYSFRQLTCAES